MYRYILLSVSLKGLADSYYLSFYYQSFINI